MSFQPRNFDGGTRVNRGRTAYHAGLSAEAQVAAHYVRQGYTLLAERWRAGRGELDLVFERGGAVVFVEVKKSRSFERAVAQLGAAQVQRLLLTAEQFLGTRAEGALTPSRFDVALVDHVGRIETLENALAAGW